MKLRGIIYLWTTILLLITFQAPRAANSSPKSLPSQIVDNQSNFNEKQDASYEKTIGDLFDEASRKYSLDFGEAATLNSQFKNLLGINPAFKSNVFMYPDRAALLESSAIRNLYKVLMDNQSPLENIRINNTSDTYIYDSSI